MQDFKISSNNNCNKTFENIVWKIFIVLLIIPIFFVIYSAIASKFDTKEDTKVNVINWKAEYPFKDETKSFEDSSSDLNFVLIVKKYENMFSNMNNIWDKVPKEEKIYKKLSQLGIWVNSKFSDISSSSDYIKLKNGLWIQKKNEVNDEKYDSFVANVENLQCYLAEQNIELLYVIPPTKDSKYDSQLPYGTEDYSNENLDLLREKLEKKGIRVEDLRDDIYKDGLNHEDLFYISDHHWNVDCGKWAADKVAIYVNQNMNGNLDLSDLESENFYKEDYGKIEFGSVGNSLGKNIISPDDFSVLYPTFKTNYDFAIPGIDLMETGSFEDVFINYESLEKIKQEPASAYGTLLYGNNAVTYINNKCTKSEEKVLMIKDSYSLAMAPYFSLTCKELMMLDLRLDLNGFDGSVHSFISKHKPNYVIIMYSWPIDRDFK